MLELRVIESVLQMGSGYVLDFTDRQLHCLLPESTASTLTIERYRADGTSKAKRLRCFLRSTPPPLAGQVLAGLLMHRLASTPDGVSVSDREGFGRAVERLGGQLQAAKPSGETEADLLRRVFRPEVFGKLPIDVAMSVPAPWTAWLRRIGASRAVPIWPPSFCAAACWRACVSGSGRNIRSAQNFGAIRLIMASKRRSFTNGGYGNGSRCLVTWATCRRT